MMSESQTTQSDPSESKVKPNSYCLNCLYDLAHLVNHQCPECGQAFDPNDKSTYFSHVELKGKPPYGIFYTVICIAATICTCIPFANIFVLIAACAVTFIIFNEVSAEIKTLALFTVIYVIILAALPLFVIATLP